MQTLITAGQVIDLAFGGAASGIRESSISEVSIISAERKFIRPVLGSLVDRLADGSHEDLLRDYIRPALALYVKYLVLPTLTYGVGGLGVTTRKGNNFETVSAAELTALRKRTRADAHTLMRRAAEHIERDLSSYPDYDPHANILNRRSVDSDIVL